jgi:DNA-binding CsgD family transcriptional regulator
VLIGDPDARLATPEQVVARLYGLTSSEARLAVAVASGDSLDGSAAAREISVSTVRQQMKQVFAKTGVRRQADLVRLLLTGPAAALNRRE